MGNFDEVIYIFITRLYCLFLREVLECEDYMFMMAGMVSKLASVLASRLYCKLDRPLISS